MGADGNLAALGGDPIRNRHHDAAERGHRHHAARGSGITPGGGGCRCQEQADDRGHRQHHASAAKGSAGGHRQLPVLRRRHADGAHRVSHRRRVRCDLHQERRQDRDDARHERFPCRQAPGSDQPQDRAAVRQARFCDVAGAGAHRRRRAGRRIPAVAGAGPGRLIERFGTLGLGPVLESAASLAQNGYVITAQLSDSLKAAAGMLVREPTAYALYPPMDGGMLLRNPDLASVLQDIGRNGINGFYRGEVGATIVAAIKRRDGFITARDMASPSSQWVEPVGMQYRDVTVLELPPPTQGLTALALLARLQRLPPAELAAGPGLIAAYRAARDAAYGLRDRLISDPDFAPVPTEPFLDPDAAVTADSVGPDGGDTVYLCAADEHGNLVSLIQSVAYDFGSGIVAEGTGILLQ